MAANYEVVNRDNDGLHTYLAHQGKPAALKIYESPTSAAGSLKDLRSLNEVVSAEAETSACVVVSGVSGYSSFLNGIYNRIEEILHHGRYEAGQMEAGADIVCWKLTIIQGLYTAGTSRCRTATPPPWPSTSTCTSKYG